MKKKHKVVLGLSRLTIPDKIQMARNFVKSLTGNPDFQKPIPDLAELIIAVDELEKRYMQAILFRQSASRERALQNQQVTVVDSLLSSLGHYVQSVSFGDEAMIRSAGMNIKTDGISVGIPLAPGSFSASEGPLKGSLVLKWKTVRGANAYTLQVTEDIGNAASWQQLGIVTKTSFLAEGLQSGKQYWFQVSATGAAGQGPWSDPATKVAP